MKTSLGIWALGPMVTRFVPGGYQPDRSEPVAEKVHRAVAGLGDLMDDYEFHYPGELSRENLDDVRAALDGHGIYAIASGLHVDPRFGKGGLTALDDTVRTEALRLCLEAADPTSPAGSARR
jgi:xylose isomerase